MNLVAAGLNHHTSTLELRERLYFAPEQIPGALLYLRKLLGGGGAVILSTCNRVEIYAHHSAPPEDVIGLIRRFLREWHSVPEETFAEQMYVHTDQEAIGHLFRVACGLDSLVLGEAQVLGQVHDAYLMAQTEQTADKVIHALFQRAFAVAKEVRSNSGIGAGKVSIGSVAADLAVSIFSELGDKTVLVVGSGKMGELTLSRLVERGVGRVLVANRSAGKMEELAGRFEGEPVGFAELAEQLHRADIIISSTAASEYVLAPQHFQQALRMRDQRPMFAIDIAVPRDIDPKVNELDNVHLYDVDDLSGVTQANIEERRKAVSYCMGVIDEAAERFWTWVQGLAAESTIVSMSRELHAVRERELAKTLANLPELNEKEREEVTYLSKRIVNAILQRPMTQLKREVAERDPHTVLHLVKRLFGLKEGP